jgi:hypothetical protein
MAAIVSPAPGLSNAPDYGRRFRVITDDARREADMRSLRFAYQH